MKIYYLIIFTFLFLSCQGEKTDEAPLLPIAEKKGTLDQRIDSYLKVKLSISGTEKYTMNKYQSHLNDDDQLDYIITVNLLDRAMKEAKESDQAVLKSQLAYAGRFNYFFFVDGKTEKMSAPFCVPSNPHAPLKVTFDYITTDLNNDIMVDFHLGTAMWRSFFTIEGDKVFEVCRSELFKNLNKVDQVGYYIELNPEKGSKAKRIDVFEADIEPFVLNTPEDAFRIEPKRTKKATLVRSWQFNPNAAKYYISTKE